MKYVLDASAAIAYLRGEPGADRVETLLNSWTFAKSPFKPPNGDFVKSKTLEIRAKTIFAKWRLAV